MSFHEEIPPDTQSKPPLVHFEAISLRPVTGHLRKEPDTSLLQPPFR